MLFEKLTGEEKEMISFLRENYQNRIDDGFLRGTFVSNETFLRYWENAKAPLAKAFGDNLIIRKPIQSVIDDQELHDKMSHLTWTDEFKRLRSYVFDLWRRNNQDNWSRRYLKDTIDNVIEISLEEVCRYYVFYVDAWITNKYDGPTCEISVGSGKVIKLVHGCKLMKTLGRFAKECGCFDEFEYLRLRQSQILNEANIRANLCLSIHPLDFMTASFNENDWRSCMCWEDGEFRRGVIEMMNSPMVVVAYLESASNSLHLCDDLKWNSKRWREFFIVRPDMLSGIKGYPYWNRNLEDETLNWLRQLFAPFFNVEYCDNIKVWETRHTIIDLGNDVKADVRMECGPAMYNDFYEGNDYHSIFVKGLKTDKRLYINYSGESECVCCGEVDRSFNSEGDLCCDSCVETYYCDKCGCAITDENDMYELNGRHYCRYCYEQLPECSICNEIVDDEVDTIYNFMIGWDEKSDILDVMTAVPNRWGDSYNLKFRVCPECAKKVFVDGEAEFEKELKIFRSWSSEYPIVPMSHITPKGLELLCSREELEQFKSCHKDEALSA